MYCVTFEYCAGNFIALFHDRNAPQINYMLYKITFQVSQIQMREQAFGKPKL